MRHQLSFGFWVTLFAVSAQAQTTQAQALQLQLTPAEGWTTAGDTARFALIARDASGRVVPVDSIRWRGGPQDMIVAEGSPGLFRALRQGDATILAMVGGRTITGVLHIRPKPPVRMEVVADAGVLVPGASTVMHATPRTVDNEPLRTAPVTFRSADPRIATVDASGLITGRAIGATRILAESGTARGDVEVRVIANPVRQLEVKSSATTVRTGDVTHLTATARDARGDAVHDLGMQWSVGGTGAHIFPDATFVAEQPGSYLITATVGNVAATTSIAVQPRVHGRKFERVTHRSFGPDIQGAELWATGNVLYMTTAGDRMYTFDISDPANPVKVDSLVMDARLLNDISTTKDGRIGVLSREGASNRRNGILFLDLSDPLHPKILSDYTESITGGVHSAFIDEPYVYITDSVRRLLRIIDFRDPRKPKEVATWEINSPAVYEVSACTDRICANNMIAGRILHDVQVKDGLAYLAYWKHGVIILDVGAGIRGGSPEKPQFVSQFTYNTADYYPPDMLAGTHSVFRYKNYLFVGDEVFPGIFDINSHDRIKTLGRVHVLDVSDISNPRKVAEYHVPEKGSHNFWIDDDVMYVGNFEAGGRAVDVSGELRGNLRDQGREIGDVWTGAPGTFRPNLPMAWGAQPHRGFVFINDINSGMWVAKLTPRVVP